MKKSLLTIAALLIGGATFAQTYVLDKTIPLTGEGGYDYLSIDKVNNRLYVSHGTMVNVVDLATEKQVGVIENLKGIHGIAIDNKANLGFISDGRANQVVAFDLKTLKTVGSVPLDSKGADAIMYDSFSDRVYTFNGDSNNSSVVNPNTLKQVGTIALGGAPEFAVSDGKGKIYNNLEDKNSLNVIDTKTLKVIKNYPLAPKGAPTGIALDEKNKRTFSVSRENNSMVVIDITTGKVVATVPIGAGVDAVAYDAETKLIFCSNGDGTTTIIKQESADKYSVIQTLATQNRAKTLALDSKTHKIYLSVVNFEPGTRKALPNSFKVLVYKQQ
ncbi:MAG: beta-propeller repeat-containing protein [Mucilaginibacter sp.]|uniref:YncE family protein n=1 Tax=Mucilaginibacter sp. TaxID=1882438 RepID=UPI002633A3FB|nr:YncE family protein [Mucilaginibacter sp.]MDB5003101.1 beta-propeller repeat-containing protein [Mucilaginibacter sp.]